MVSNSSLMPDTGLMSRDTNEDYIKDTSGSSCHVLHVPLVYTAAVPNSFIF